MKLFLIIISIALIALAFITWGKKLTIIENGTIITSNSTIKPFKYGGAKKVEADSYHPYLIGTNTDQAVTSALKKAGPEYDMLINATLEVKFYYMIVYFSNYNTIKGTAVNSKALKGEMGEKRYISWLAKQNVLQRNVK